MDGCCKLLLLLRPEEEFRLAGDGRAAAGRVHGSQPLPRKSPLPVNEEQHAAGAQDDGLHDSDQARQRVDDGTGEAHCVPGHPVLGHTFRVPSERFYVG